MKLAPLVPVTTESISAIAYAVVSRHEAARKLEADFGEECRMEKEKETEKAYRRDRAKTSGLCPRCYLRCANGKQCVPCATFDMAMDEGARALSENATTKALAMGVYRT